MAVKFRVSGVQRTISRFKLRRKSVRDRMGDEMRESAEDIADIAQMMAPRKSGTLESAIEVGEETVNTALRMQLSVFVDENVKNDKGRALKHYAARQHDLLEPYGGLMKLREESIRKDNTTPWIVGGGYMERAHQEVEPTVGKRMRDAVTKGIRGLIG